MEEEKMALQGFDANYYLEAKLAQVKAAAPATFGSMTTADFQAFLLSVGFTPESHYMAYGYLEGFEPNAYFDHDQYIYNKAVQMVQLGGYQGTTEAMAAFRLAWPFDAYQHYLMYGAAEGIDASNNFDESAYLAEKLSDLQAADAATWGNRDINYLRGVILAAGLTPLTHYMAYGATEGNAGPWPVSSTAVLTGSQDVRSANVFTAGRTWNPDGSDQMNSLNDDDQLSGIGTNPTLDFTYVNDSETGDYSIHPVMNGVQTINIRFDTNAPGNAILDLQDSVDVQNLNINRIDDNLATATVQNEQDGFVAISINNVQAPGANVVTTSLDAGLVGTADSTAVTLNAANIATYTVQGQLGAQGYETITLDSIGSANAIGTMTAQSLQTLTITGSQNLTLGTTQVIGNAASGQMEAIRYAAGLANVAGSLTVVDASALTGNFSYTIGGEINASLDNTSGVQVNMLVRGGTGTNTFRLAPGASVQAADTITGGSGADLITAFGGVSTIAGTGNLGAVETLEIRTGHDLLAAADAVTVDTRAFTELGAIFIRNEGMVLGVGTQPWDSAAEGMTVTLNQLTAAEATNITIAHGTTGNSGIANNIIIGGFRTAATNNATQLTLVDGVNVDPVFNLQFTPASSELVTIVDNDTESNTVHLNQGAFTQAGSTITIMPGDVADTGSYMNLDSTANGAVALAAMVDGAGTYDYVRSAGYGRVKDGAAGDNTTYLTAESAQQLNITLGGFATRDAEVSTVFYGTAGVAGDLVTRHAVENVAAGTYEGNVEIRLGDVTRADGVSSMAITTSTGSDTFIFDAIGVVNAGFTSGDTITAGTGTDTLVLDGNTATIPGTPRIDHQNSEWDNLHGIDVLRFANNAGVANGGNAVQVANAGGAYYARIDNDFIAQTDAGNRLTILNNDGELTNNSESDLVLDLRGLSQNMWVTFQGANANGGAGLSSNRLVVDDISANQNMILDGGDTDVRNLAAVNWAGYTAGNNNVYEVRNQANLSVNDLAQVSNFGRIDFTNDAASDQVLTLTLNNTIVENLVDQSRTATTVATQEVLQIVATDSVPVPLAGSILNIDARAVTGFLSLNVTGSNDASAFDIAYLNSNVGGSSNFVDLGVGTGDRVNFSGTATTATIIMGNWIDNVTVDGLPTLTEVGTAFFQTGAIITGHVVENTEIVDLSAMTLTTSTVTGSAAAETIIGGAGADAITGDAGYDNLTGGAGNDNFVYNVATSSQFAAETFGATAWVDKDTVATGAIVAGETVTTVEVINGIVTGDTITTGNAALIADAGTANMLEDNEYLIVQGDYVAATGVFTVGVGLNTGADSLLIFDADAAATFEWQAVVLLGVTSAEEAAIVNTAGVLSVFGA
jgi:hypothetical protein